ALLPKSGDLVDREREKRRDPRKTSRRTHSVLVAESTGPAAPTSCASEMTRAHCAPPGASSTIPLLGDNLAVLRAFFPHEAVVVGGRHVHLSMARHLERL